MADDEFVELLWEYSQLATQGHSKRTKKSSSPTVFHSHTGKAQEKESREQNLCEGAGSIAVTTSRNNKKALSATSSNPMEYKASVESVAKSRSSEKASAASSSKAVESTFVESTSFEECSDNPL